MVMLRTFRGIRPDPQNAEKVASFPYDVINSKEAREIAKDNKMSFLHVVKPEIDLPEDIDHYDDQVYNKAHDNFNQMITNGVLIQDESPALYLYKQKMGDHEQYGIVGCTSADEYDENIIKKHELTRKEKEDDRTKHVLTVNANTGPVFLTYRDSSEVDHTISNFVINNQPIYKFTKEDQIEHTFWVISDLETQNKLTEQFKSIPALYVADGHHRSASAARAQKEKASKDPNSSKEKEYNYFLSVIFPASQLKILDYNRVVKNLNNLTSDDFINQIKEKFDIIEDYGPMPKNPKEFSMYFNNQWYGIIPKDKTFNSQDPIESLDVAILQNNLLAPILNIGDPRTDNNIDFVGGIRGHEELEKRVKSGECQVAFRLYPTSINELLNVADANKIMPPKSTWFEPKLRSGLISHLLD